MKSARKFRALEPMENVDFFLLHQLQIRRDDFMKKNLLAVILAMCAGALAAAQQNIPVGGPIPDGRGFNIRVDDPVAVAAVKVIVRKVAGNIYVVAGAGGNVVVQFGNDGLQMVGKILSGFYS